MQLPTLVHALLLEGDVGLVAVSVAVDKAGRRLANPTQALPPG